MMRRLASLRGWWSCRRGMHDWHVRQVAVDGAIATVPLCRRCPAIDVENVTVEGWNREERRRAARQVARRLIDGHAR